MRTIERIRAGLVLLLLLVSLSCSSPLRVVTPEIASPVVSGNEPVLETPQPNPGKASPTLSSEPEQDLLPLVDQSSKSKHTATSQPRASQPNILIIMSDDQRFDTMDYMPETQTQIFDQGVTFTRGYITTDSCCPSRASMLTGLYAHHHGVLVNQDELHKPTFVEDLNAAGYNTGLVGKYLNSWNGEPRPEFDYWVSFDGGGSPYNDPELNVQGVWGHFPGYITYLLEDYAQQFIQEAAQKPEPFLLIFTPTAPHDPANPAPGDENLYPDLKPYRPPSFDEQDISDKPAWMQEYEPYSEELIQDIDTFRRKQLQTLHSLDQSVSEILKTLKETGQLDNTFIVYYSDNGYFWGEHRLRRGKTYAYEEGILVPFAIRYPPLVPKPRIDSHLVANIDLAPTFYQLAGLPVPKSIDGLSLIPLLEGKDNGWRENLIIENWASRFGSYYAVRSDQYLYVDWNGYDSELYDMQVDPFQLDNRENDPEYAWVIDHFRKFLKENVPSSDQ